MSHDKPCVRGVVVALAMTLPYPHIGPVPLEWRRRLTSDHNRPLRSSLLWTELAGAHIRKIHRIRLVDNRGTAAAERHKTHSEWPQRPKIANNLDNVASGERSSTQSDRKSDPNKIVSRLLIPIALCATNLSFRVNKSIQVH